MNTPVPTPSETAIAALPTATSLPDMDTISGERVTNPEAQISFVLPNGWQIGTNAGAAGFGTTTLTNESAGSIGIYLMPMTGARNSLNVPAGQELPIDDLIDWTSKNVSSDLTMTERTDFTVAGYAGRTANFSGTLGDGQPVTGRAIIAPIDDRRVLLIRGYVAAETWDASAFETVVQTFRVDAPAE